MRGLRILFLLGAALSPLQAGGGQEGDVLDKLDSGEYAPAWEYYSQRSDGSGRDLYNQGLAALGMGRFEDAGVLFQRAGSLLEGKEAARSYYNLGFSELSRVSGFLQEGGSPEAGETDPAALLQSSLENFRRAWELDPRLTDAARNAELAAQLLTRLQAQNSQPSSAEPPPSGARDPSEGETEDLLNRQKDLQDQTASENPPQPQQQRDLADDTQAAADSGNPAARENLEQASDHQNRATQALADEDREEALRQQQKAVEALQEALNQGRPEPSEEPESPGDREDAASSIIREEQENREERESRQTLHIRGGISDVERDW